MSDELEQDVWAYRQAVLEHLNELDLLLHKVGIEPDEELRQELTKFKELDIAREVNVDE